MLCKLNSQTWLDAYLVEVATALADAAVTDSTFQEEADELGFNCSIANIRSNSECCRITYSGNLANIALLDTYLDTSFPFVVELITDFWDELVSCLAIFVTNLIARDTSSTTDVNLCACANRNESHHKAQHNLLHNQSF